MARYKRSKGKKNNHDIKPPSSRFFALILSCFIVSGLTGLTYQILWTRMIVKIIGSAPFAVSIVLTVFMGGLGLGSYLAGRNIDRVKDPIRLVRLYGILELAIGAYGIILPLLLVLFRPIYSIIYNYLFGHFLVYNLFTFVGCFILLIIPVTCMGATLPILSRFFITSISKVGTHVGRLYGLNTIGAAAGSVLCGFWLIDSLGVYGSLIFAIVLNGLIGGICILVSSRMQKRGGSSEALAESKDGSFEKHGPGMTLPGDTRGYDTYALVIFAVSGFCAMAYEVIWAKLLGLIVGPTTYSFTIVLVTFISGLALGSIFFGWLGDRIRNVPLLLLITQIAAALSALFLSQVMGNSQIFFAKLIYNFKDHFAQLALLKALILFLFMFFPTFFLGASFPLVGKIYTRSLARTGRSIGYAYAINSVGAVLGSFCAGFVLVPLIGKEHGLAMVVAIQLLTVLAITLHMAWKGREKVSRWIPLAIPALLGLLLLFNYPYWDRKMLSIGKYHRFENAGIRDVGWFRALFPEAGLFEDFVNAEIVFFGDGIGGFTTVIKADMDILGNQGFCMYNSGKADASSKLDMDTQTLSAHLPMLFHRDPRNVLVVGLASGITAGEILLYPIERLDVVEISGQVATASNIFLPWNYNVLSDPRTELIVQDGRAHLELTDRKYDVISSEPSNPWMAGLATLFTREFFSLARDRLNDNGIFVQFIHTYQMDWPTFALVGRTFQNIFPNSMLVRTNPSRLGPDFLLVGIRGDKGLDEQTAERNLRYAGKSKNIRIPNHRLLYQLFVSEDLKRLFGEGPVNTDNRPWLEFSAPKLMHYTDLMMDRTIISNSWLSEETRKILKDDLRDIDAQIDLADYTLQVIRPEIAFQNQVDLSRASDLQKDRLYGIMERHCAENIVTDFSHFGDDDIKGRCISIQIQTVKEKLPAASDKVPLYLHLGALFSEKGMLDEAVRNFSEGLRLDPGNRHAYYNMGNALKKQGRIAEAVEHYSEAVRISPNYTDALNNLAWILATDRDSGLRNGDRAVRLAEHACDISNNKDPFLLDTLAAAYAETGSFKKARNTAQKAVELAQATGYQGLAGDIEKRLKLYRSSLPFHREK